MSSHESRELNAQTIKCSPLYRACEFPSKLVLECGQYIYLFLLPCRGKGRACLDIWKSNAYGLLEAEQRNL
jgi:hypothetical protein